MLRPDLDIRGDSPARLTTELLPIGPRHTGCCADAAHRRVARRASRRTAIRALDEQDRSRWNRDQIEDGERADRALAMRAPGPYQTQAAIAALHSTARTAADTDWRQIAALYDVLADADADAGRRVERGALRANDGWSTRGARTHPAPSRRAARLRNITKPPAAKADVLRRMGRSEEAADSYRAALALVTNPAERRWLTAAQAGRRNGEVVAELLVRLTGGLNAMRGGRRAELKFGRSADSEVPPCAKLFRPQRRRRIDGRRASRGHPARGERHDDEHRGRSRGT